jgi:hypothetical protein
MIDMRAMRRTEGFYSGFESRTKAKDNGIYTPFKLEV